MILKSIDNVRLQGLYYVEDVSRHQHDKNHKAVWQHNSGDDYSLL